MERKNSIVLALLGLTPQVVVEGIYYLAVECKIPIKEIKIITTEEIAKTKLEILNEQLKNLSEYYKINLPKLRKENIIIGHDDIPSAKEQKSKPIRDVVLEEVYNLTKDEKNELHCIISGGRKTMSVDLATALTIFGRAQDKMYHILVSKEFENSKKFFPETKSEAKQLTLIEKDFIRLREKLNFTNELQNIGNIDIIKLVQQKIDECTKLEDLILNLKDRSVTIGNTRFFLQPLQFAIYLFFAKEKNFIKGGKNLSRKHSDTIWKYYKKLSTSRGQTERVQKTLYNDMFDFSVIQKAISNIKTQIKKALNNNPLMNFYIISIEGSYADKRYGIKLPKDKIKIIK